MTNSTEQFYDYLDEQFSAENLSYLLKDTVLKKAKETNVNFDEKKLEAYLNAKINMHHKEKVADKYIKSLSATKFKERADEWKIEIKKEAQEVKNIMEQKVRTEKAFKERTQIIKEAYEKALKRREYIKELAKKEKNSDKKDIMKKMINSSNKWLKELDKIYEKEAKELSKYMIKNVIGKSDKKINEEFLEKNLIAIKKAQKDILEIDAQIMAENISGDGNVRKIKGLREQKYLKAEKMYYETLAIRIAIEEDIAKNGSDKSKEKRIKIVTGIANGFKDILNEEEDLLAKDKAYKQVLIDEGVVEE